MKKCRACKRDMLTDEDFPRKADLDEEEVPNELPIPGAGICMKCGMAASVWGIEKWIKKGAPGAKKA